MAEGTTPLFVNWRTGEPTNPYGSSPNNVWTPTLTFGTPGDLAVSYSSRVGVYAAIGKLIFISFNVITSSFTYTTSSDSLFITGIPFTNFSGMNYVGPLRWGGITPAIAGYTDINCRITGVTLNKIEFRLNGAGLPGTSVSPSDVPSGSTVNLNGSVLYVAQ